jgi:hypothetical protein
MNPSLQFGLFAFIGCITTIIAQDDPTLTARQPTSIISAAYIPEALEVPAFTPPAPPVEKQVPSMRVDSTITLPAQNSRTLTLIRGEASELPDIPAPVEAQARERRALAPEELARIADRRRRTLQFGATVFDHRLSVVHWQHPDTGEAYEAVCGFDIGMLAGIARFVSNGETYNVMLMHSHYDTTRFRNLAARMVPDLPQVPADGIAFIKGNPRDPAGTAPINLLKELLSNEESRLLTYQAARLQQQQAAAAWQKAHPPVPRDETIWLRPHRGSRYLANPQPEAAAR